MTTNQVGMWGMSGVRLGYQLHEVRVCVGVAGIRPTPPSGISLQSRSDFYYFSTLLMN